MLISNSTIINCNTNDKDSLKLIVISDIHIDKDTSKQSENFKNTLNYITKNFKNIDGIVFCGDITNHGYEEEYNKFISLLDEFGNKGWNNIYLMGNHDYCNGLDSIASKSLFKRKLGQEITLFKKIKGIDVISISTENESLNGVVSKENIREISKYIEDIPKKKPILIFTHQPPENTVYGSKFYPNKQLNELFSNNDNIMLFAGHSHCPVNNDGSIYQKNYTVVGTGAVAYLANDKEGFKVDNEFYGSQGLFLQVNKRGGITITKLDFIHKEEIGSEIKFDNLSKESFIYTPDRWAEKKKIGFRYTSKIDNLRINSKEISFSFPQCKDKKAVREYYILLRNDDEVINWYKIDSKYYMLKDQPDEIEMNIKDLSIKTDYRIEIYGIDHFGRKSRNFLTVDIDKGRVIEDFTGKLSRDE